jgi:hypothetical protein
VGSEDASPAFDALGYRFTLECDDSEVLAHLTRLFSGLRVDDANAPSDAAALPFEPSVADPAQALVNLVGHVNVCSLETAKGDVLVHSGCVADDQGRAVLVCGPPGSGKSTLTAELVRRGLAYVTDEVTSIDPIDLRITPFRKPVSLREGSHSVHPWLRPAPGSVADRLSGHHWLVAPDQLGGAEPPDRPIFPSLVVLPTHTPGTTARVSEVPLSEATYLVGANSTQLGDVTGGCLPALARVARRVRCVRLAYAEVGDAADLVAQLLTEAA